jgi:aspartate/methionine/tyrosine aminotransferase
MAAMNDPFQVSNMIQQFAGYFLRDQDFVEEYIRFNSQALTISYNYLKDSLSSIGIPIVSRAEGNISAGIFVFANFRRYLGPEEPSFEAEEGFFRELALRGVVLTPGHACHAQAAGYGRICFAWVSLTSLEEAVRRIAGLCREKEDMMKIER